MVDGQFFVREYARTRGTATMQMENRMSLLVKKVLCLVAVMLVMTTGQAFGEASDALKKTVTDCLQYSPLLKSVQQNREAIAQDLRSAEGGFYPSLDLRGGAGSQSYNDATTRSAGNEFDAHGRTQATATLTQRLYDGQESMSRVEIEEARLDAAERRLLDNAAALALDAITAHMNVHRQRELVRLAEANVSKHLEILKSIETTQLQGAGSLADVMQAKGRYTTSRTTLNADRDKLRVAMANYQRLTGQPSPADEDESPPAALSSDVDAAVEKAWKNNPKLLLKNAEIAEAEKTVALREAGFFPTVDLELESSFKDHVDAATSYAQSQSIMVVGRWNLYNGGSSTADHKAAQARLIRAKMERNDVRDSLAKSVREAWSNYQTESTNIDLYAEAIDYNTQTRDMYEQQFTVGQRNLLDVLDAENELFVTKGRHIMSVVSKIITGYRLLALEGRLLYELGLDASQYRNGN